MLPQFACQRITHVLSFPSITHTDTELTHLVPSDILLIRQYIRREAKTPRYTSHLRCVYAQSSFYCIADSAALPLPLYQPTGAHTCPHPTLPPHLPRETPPSS